jgi:hypothetical protein
MFGIPVHLCPSSPVLECGISGVSNDGRSGQGSGARRWGVGNGRPWIGRTSSHSYPKRNNRIARGRRAERTPRIARRSGVSASDATSRSLPIVTIPSVATANADYRRLARAGFVIWVCCHCHPPRLAPLPRWSHQLRRASHGASHPSGSRSVSTNHGLACPSLHHAASVPSSRQSDEAKAVPRPRQWRPAAPTSVDHQTHRA